MMDINKMKENTRFYKMFMTFLTDNDLNDLEIFKKIGKNSSPNELACFLYGYNSSNFILNNDNDGYYGIKPVITSNSDLSIFLNSGLFNKLDDITYFGGSYPSKVITDSSLIQSINQNGINLGSSYTLIIDNKEEKCNIITYKNEKYAFISSRKIYAKIEPLLWHYDKKSNKLVCNKTLSMIHKKAINGDVKSYIYNYMNKTLFKDIFSGNVISLTGRKNITFPVGTDAPFNSYIELSSDGKLYSHDENEFDIDISKKQTSIGNRFFQNVVNNVFIKDAKFNINIDNEYEALRIDSGAFDFKSVSSDFSIQNLSVKDNINYYSEQTFNVNKPIENVNMRCDSYLFALLYVSGKETCTNLLNGANITISYIDERELLYFIKEVKRLVSSFNKVLNKDSKNFNFQFGGLYFTFTNINKESFPYKKYNPIEYTMLSLKDKIGAKSITLNGPVLSNTKIYDMLGIEKTEEITYEKPKETIVENKKIAEEEKNNNLSKEAQHILELARKITSVEYIGLNRALVREKVDNIVKKYNESLQKKYDALTLTSDSLFYTQAVISLENLYDDLLIKYQKNVNYYNILDLIDIIKKNLDRNDIQKEIENLKNKISMEENFYIEELLKDLDTFLKICDYLKNYSYVYILKSNLDNDLKNINNFLYNELDVNYSNIEEFILNFRTYLMPLLTSLSAEVSKNDALKDIKDYTLQEMSEKSLESHNSYITLILNEIDKVKNDILKLDNTISLEKLTLENLNSKEEIIAYLDKMYRYYYKIYIDLEKEKSNNDNFENKKVPMIY